MTNGLSLKQARDIAAAARAAVRLGVPFNAHVTIHWERVGIRDDAASAATGRFLTYVRDWLRKQGLPFAYAYARENGDAKGSHVHILVHLPPRAAWTFKHSRRWLEAICGGAYSKHAIVTERIHGTRGGRIALPALYDGNLRRVVGYLIKGAVPTAAAALALVQREPGGRVIGKRSGCSENLRRSQQPRHAKELPATLEDHHGHSGPGEATWACQSLIPPPPNGARGTLGARSAQSER